MTYLPATTRAIEALLHVADTLDVWNAAHEFDAIAEFVRNDLLQLSAALREIGKELGQ